MSKINTYFHNSIVQDFIKLLHESYLPFYRGKSSDSSFIRKAEKLAVLIGHFPEKFNFSRPTGLLEWDFLIDLVNTIKHENRRGGKRELDIIGSHQFEFKGNLIRFFRYKIDVMNRQNDADRIGFFECCKAVMSYYAMNNPDIKGVEFEFKTRLYSFEEEARLKQSNEEFITSGVDISFVTKNEQEQIISQDPPNGFHTLFLKNPDNDKQLIFSVKLLGAEN